jgi:predicted TIM-barrel fold metal-dependent hydrolase
MIDAELHVYAGSREEILDRFEPSLAARIRDTAFRLPPASPHPGVDVFAGEVAAATDPAEVAERLPEEVEWALLVPAQIFPAAGWLDHGLAAAFAAALNDHFAQTWLPADPRFRLAAALSPHDAPAAAAELRRWAGDPRVVAGCFAPTGAGLGHPHYAPLLAEASRLELPLMMHPSGAEGIALGAPLLGGGTPRTPQETFTLLPQVAAANLASAVYDGAFETHPGLTLVLAGFGVEWAGPWLWKLDQEWRGLRADVPWLTRPPSETLAERVRFVLDESCPPLDAATRALLELVPDGMLLYGSDAPFGPGEERLAALAGHESILAGNAAATFAAGAAAATGGA